jgi:hypothetical protein
MNNRRRDVLASGVVYGLDYFFVSSDSAHVFVTPAELIKPTGGLTLVRAGFVPGGGVGSGSSGGKGFEGPAAVAGLSGTIPTELNHIPTPKGAQLPFSGSTWELAAIFKVPPDSTSASMAGIKLTYRSGLKIHTLRAVDTVQLGMTPGYCGIWQTQGVQAWPSAPGRTYLIFHVRSGRIGS